MCALIYYTHISSSSSFAIFIGYVWKLTEREFIVGVSKMYEFFSLKITTKPIFFSRLCGKKFKWRKPLRELLPNNKFKLTGENDEK